MKARFSLLVLTALLALLTACSGGGGSSGSTTYTIGGTVSGLSGSGLLLQDNGGNDLTISADGSFTFTSPMADGSSYAVTVLTQPSSPNQICTVSNGTGTVSGANVTNVAISCTTTTYTIGGTVSGLSGSGLVLQNNSGDNLSISADGSFTFTSPIADGTNYAITVLTQPSSLNQTCTVSSGSGTVSGANVTNVGISCTTNSYTIGVTATGITGGSVVLKNNGTDSLTITADGLSNFPTSLVDGTAYAVTFGGPTMGYSCSLANNTGTVSGANVIDITLTCAPVSVTVGALYPTNGTNWNDYVKNDGGGVTSATDTACTGSETGYSSCLNGGEMRVVDLPIAISCSGVTVSDSLDAFNWICDDSTATVRAISTGLKDGKNLSDLLDFTTPGWNNNSVTVSVGTDSFTTVPASWWTNPVAAAGDGTSALGTPGGIYVVAGTVSLSSDYTITASGVGLVAKPGAVINGPGLGWGSFVVSADGTSTAKDFLWIEGTVDALNDDSAIALTHVRHSVLRNISVRNAGRASSSTGYQLGAGVVLYNSSSCMLSGITAAINGQGVYLYSASSNTVSGVAVSNNSTGLYLANASNNRVSGVTESRDGTGVNMTFSTNNSLSTVTVSNTLGDGVYIQPNSSNNTLSGITVANNPHYGIFISTDSNNNTLSGITVANNGYAGIELDASSNNTLNGVTATNNAWDGIYLVNASDSSTLRGITVTNNGSHGVYLNNSSNNTFTGLLKVGNNSSGDCTVTGGTAPGLVDSTCANSGASDATLTTGVALSASFVGKTYSDSVNASATGSAVAYPYYTVLSFDWVNFQNAFRGWGKDGTFGDSSSRGSWTAGLYGAIWDWSVATGDTELKDVLVLPGGNDTLTQIWAGTPTTNDDTGCNALVADSTWSATDSACETTFLRNAAEIQGDGIGNDNTLCESHETCLYTPNIGSYQGHGNLISAGSFTDGVLTGITLMKYESNGR